MASTSRAAARLVLLGAVIAGLGFSCEKRVNDSSVSLLVTVRASLGDAGQQGGGDVVDTDDRIVALSADGRYVVFVSKAPDLVPGDNNRAADVFVRDMVSRTTVLASANKFNSGPGNRASGSPSISADGRYVAFISESTDLHDDDTDTIVDVFVRDLVLQQTTLISQQSGTSNEKADGNCANPVISGDGRYVVFDTVADNLDGFNGPAPTGGDDVDALSDVYRRDFLDPGLGFATILISRASDTPGLPPTPGVKGNNSSLRPRLSTDGNFIVFESNADNLVAGDGNSVKDCFVRDVDAGVTRRVSLTDTGTSTNGISDVPSISGDGAYVVFRSNASNIHPDDDGAANDIFLYEMGSGAVIICSQHTFGTQAGNTCNFPVITADGRFIVFQSDATSLVNGDNNGRTDIFRHDRISRETIRLAVSTYGGELNGNSIRPAVSADGQYFAFVTDATNAADDDSNGAVDVYLRGPPR